MTSTDTTSKPFKIEKRQVYQAYKAVKSNLLTSAPSANLTRRENLRS